MSRPSDSGWKVIGLLDWQHASILPPFLSADVPDRPQNYNDPILQSTMRPSLPKDFDELTETEQSREEELCRRCPVHYHYVKIMEECNGLYYAVLTDPAGVPRRRLFDHASNPWEGETLALKVALIEATANWETLTGGGAPCPVVFSAEDVRETMKLDEEQRGTDEALEVCPNVIGVGLEGWVPTEHYEEAMARSKQMKEDALAMVTEEERAEVVGHWPPDDMDEEEYM